MKNVFFLGIGGMGMSALARYYRFLGYDIWGYDRTRSELCVKLEETDDCHIVYEEKDDYIEMLKERDFEMVVVTPAVPKDNLYYSYFEKKGMAMKKRAQVLGDITREKRGVCVAGTHGKTTTSTMVAHLLKHSHVDCSAFLGGISRNFGSNLVLAENGTDIVAIEADEFDRSFHQLTPWIAVVTATDADHLDIYGTHEAYLDAFAHFTSLIVDGGVLLKKEGIKLECRAKENVRRYTYSAGGDSADFRAGNVRVGNGKILFDFVYPDGVVRDVELGVPVMVNVENAVAAMAVGVICGMTDDELKNGMMTFRGVERRFEVKYNADGKVHIDDFAHHPDELKRSIESVNMLYEGKKTVVAFQPHLFTRTRDFYKEFAKALSMAEQVVVLDIYPAREAPIEGVTSKIIYDELTSKVKRLSSLKGLQTTLDEMEWDVLLTVGAGDIGLFKIGK